MLLWQTISAHISTATGKPFTVESQRSVGGGCINDACVVGNGDVSYFVKTNTAVCAFMFEAEAAGLAEIAGTHAICVPQPVCFGIAGNAAYLVLECLEFGQGKSETQRSLGAQLAAMHQIRHKQYGWCRDNTIGSTPQSNAEMGNWVDFWRESRLGFQLSLAVRNGAPAAIERKGESLKASLASFFPGIMPPPSLLHGDLWSGNWAADSEGNPVIFDPAVYYGDRETDIAMTELFGGFSPDFYAAYREAYPLDAGYKVRKTLYNLYHILNHYNLFGGGYASQAERMIDSLLSEIR